MATTYRNPLAPEPSNPWDNIGRGGYVLDLEGLYEATEAAIEESRARRELGLSRPMFSHAMPRGAY